MSPKVISSKEVSTKVLGSANPFAKGFRDAKKGCMDSVGGIFLGFVLFAVAFIPAWCSVKSIKAVSKDVEALPLVAAADVSGQSGMVKINGNPTNIDSIELDIECKDLNETIDVFWYKWTLQEYTRHTETRTETEIRDGQEVEVTYEDEVQDWEIIDEEEDHAGSFFLGDIEIIPASANFKVRNFQTCDDKGREELGEQWLTVEYLPVEDLGNLLVVGNLSNNEIKSGTPFIVTDMSADELVLSMAQGERAGRMGLTILSMVLFFISFNLIIGPLLFVLNYVPLIGGGLRAMIGVVSLVLAIIWVLILKFIIMYWWLILILLAGLIFLLIAVAKKKRPAPAHEAAAHPAAQPQAPGTSAPRGKFCTKCGTAVDADEKFCKNCGEKQE